MIFDLDAVGFTSLQGDGTSEPSESELADDLGYEFSGTMRWLIVERAGDEIVAQVDFPGAQGSVYRHGEDYEGREREREDAGVRRTDGAGFSTLVKLATSGRVLGYCFDPRMAPHVQSRVRGLVSALRFVAVDPLSGGWFTEEQGPLGLCQIEYERAEGRSDGGTATLELRRWGLELATDERLDVQVLDSTASAIFDRELGWWRSIRTQHHVQGSVCGRLDFQHSLEVICELRTTERVPLDRLPAADMASPWVVEGERTKLHSSESVFLGDACGGTPDAASFSDELTAALEMADSISSQPWLAIGRLAIVLENSPNSLAIVRSMLGDSSITETQWAALLGGVGAVGSDAAQQLLSSIALDPQLPEHLRRSACRGYVEVPQPTLDAIGIASALVDAGGSLAADGLSLMGIVGSKQSDSAAEEISQRLAGLETWAIDRGLLDEWIDAVGSVVSPTSEQILRRFEDYDDRHRSEAMVVLQGGIGKGN